jgi:hypothetical protein
LPVILTVLFSAIKPFFVTRYLIFVIPYLEFVFAESVVGLIFSDSWKNRSFIGLPVQLIYRYIGIFIFLTLILFSSMGTSYYFGSFQKEDYRGVSKFMSKNCLTGLRLYFPQYVQTYGYGTYYNKNLYSQLPSWQNLLDKNLDPITLSKLLAGTYDKVCLMVGDSYPQTFNQDKRNISLIRQALQLKYSEVINTKFYALEVDLYQNPK